MTSAEACRHINETMVSPKVQLCATLLESYMCMVQILEHYTVFEINTKPPQINPWLSTVQYRI